MPWTAALAAALSLAVAVVVTVILVRPARPPRPWADVERHRVLVTVANGDAFKGVLWSINAEYLVLRDASQVTTERPVDGELLIERPVVAYVQVLP